MKQTLTLAYSPCPNDTFIFYHLVHQTISEKLNFKEELHDVEELNLSASLGKFDCTKLSYFAYFHVLEKYILLNSGSALGRACGPILVKKKGKNIKKLTKEKILVPGLNTTANLLLQIYLNQKANTIPLRYDLIMNKILNEEFSLGVIIHEERFTYEDKGLEKVVDLGEFWESETSYPIPLGGIAIKREYSKEIQLEAEISIRKSLELAYQNSSITKNYILENSQVKEEEIVQKHIDLYVNSFTKDLTKTGRDAVQKLYEYTLNLGLIQNSSKELIL
jgi:predicted solute-binding protein